ncbi:trichodiene oxygenase [Pleomassaria siparia CBS 279.74]|uniref:Trichodiene oxygenase n=1 Tax=Pleomassaria siparia CBS 279.74 TaxID=1314801 RepID=A0A6G1JU65_9PLEO|nr:trichodiene oxygenase [Pleomassaria siparia CBS 279.74]
MEFNINWPIFVGAAIAYYCTLAFYRLFLHPLARFPGPRIAAVSRWYEGYYDVILGGQYTSKIQELHTIYGPIIRISPYELHVIDPEFFDTLYRTDGRWNKYSWAYDAFGAKNSTIFGSDHDAHKSRRRAIAPFFSKPSVAARRQLLRRNVDKLCQRISKLAGTTFNLGAAISAFTRDNANEYIIGKEYNELGFEDFGVGLSVASQGAGVFWTTTKHVRWFGPTMRAIPIPWAMKMADEGTKAFLRYLQQSEQDARDTMTDAQSSSSDNKDQNTIVHAILHSALPPAEKTFERVFEEIATVTGAGFETTANTLRLIFYHVYSNDEVLARLRKEIASIRTESSEPIALKKLEQQPYLTAVIMEGMRLNPAVASRAARITDKDLFYDKWCIPAGTPVGMTSLLMHTNEKLYPNPMHFNPDRWIDSTPPGAASSKFAPFSRGTRICLGMHLAWAEMYLLLAALVQDFTFAIKGATAGDFELERDNFGIGVKAACNLMAHVTPCEG